jgi:N-acetylmuramoyl-L-alanine amidase
MARVFIGVGHGGTDSGAIGIGGLLEKSLNLSIATTCATELTRHGVTVQLSRTTDENDPVSQEVAECNKFAPDLAVDIHNNAGGGDGAEVYYHHRGGKGKDLANNILNEIVKIGQNSRGVKTRVNSSGRDYYQFIRDTKAPAVIVECAFVDNPEDVKILDTLHEQEQMGIAIAKGVLKQLGINYTSGSKVYRVQVGAYNKRENAEEMLEKVKKAGFNAFITKG